MSNNDHKSIYKRACAYPFVKPEMFHHNVRVSIETGLTSPVADLLLTNSAFSKQLDGSDILLPTYDVKLTDGTTLEGRVALIGIGSNCSPDIMGKKLRDKLSKEHIGGDFILAQATLEDHAIVYGAFLGAAGTIPATVIQDTGGGSAITVTLLTMEQAEALTETEPNYDLVHLPERVPLRNLNGNPTLTNGALLYVSIWGAGAYQNSDVVAVQDIGQATSFPKMSSKDVVHAAARIISPDIGKDVFRTKTAALFNSFSSFMFEPDDTQEQRLNKLKQRLDITDLLQENNRPAIMHGHQVKKSTIGIQAAEVGYSAPSIRYFN